MDTTGTPTARNHRALLGTGAVAALLLLAAVAAGCDAEPAGSTGPAANLPDAGWSQELFESSIDSLDHLEDFNGPEMLAQAMQGLNQSLAGSAQTDNWQPDPMVFSLPLVYRALPAVKNLGATQFDVLGALDLQEAFWLRDASRAARGDRADDLSRAKSLFDWTVRNIQLTPEAVAADGYDLLHSPRQLLLLGRGNAIERAWLFILLARQQGLDVVMLGIPDDVRATGYRPWLPALLSSGQLYLFDTRLGLPIPTADGQSVATLEQVSADDSLLRALDVEGLPYPVKAEDLQQLVVLIEGSPAYLSRRARMVELRLTGERKVVLTVPASTLADRLKTLKQVKEVRLWDIPYQYLADQSLPEYREESARELAPYQIDRLPRELRPAGAALQQGRVMQIRGHYAQEEDSQAASANAMFQIARAPDVDAAQARLSPEQLTVLEHTRQDASYWLGLVAFERQRYAAAVEHLKKRTLEASPTGPWSAGARYNLARCYEQLGRLPEAIELYEADQSPQRHGNLLRARQLKGAQPAEETSAAEKPAEENSPEEKPSDEKPPAEPAAEEKRAEDPSS
ncbi:MAG: tetratricopeptide repeat protein [Planctomycetaceae bacterium]|nr:tetratricopeptide repeat protein [Planctomycetaceae bacterium]